MNNVNKTLYIPLYGKAYVSRRGIILRDETAEAIWDAEGFPLKGKSSSKWLAYEMGMRAAVFDRWLAENMDADPNCAVLHLGCGMDSRVRRVGTRGHLWFDVDFPEVLWERQRYYRESPEYRMIGSDLRDLDWLEAMPRGGSAVIVMEGISMYLAPEELKTLLKSLNARFDRVRILMDCYTEAAARASRYKNPINDVGVTLVYGIDNPSALEAGTGLTYIREHEMTPADLIAQLRGVEQVIFKKVFAGTLAKKLYRIYEYQ